ncbi:uncharacterized protein LOC133530144 isoform X2 [Cydia pomonella]|uniref:uncharacterized protein LOC133530144 isoform X2 n=1 Tax=Cydia pomonella TaxID=82600 RepID=UPI002ADD5D59|nr:uncharacterized protein LOC133530144 isoform X2 [Cydia pomonella]
MACIANADCTDGSIHNDQHINDNITTTIQSFKVISGNNTNIMPSNETTHENIPLRQSGNGGEYQNMLNNSLPATPNRTTKYSESVTQPSYTIPPIPFSCPEEETPANIGPYEVPTQRDLVLHIRNHLLAMYRGFHAKAMYFLKDVKEATQASWSRKMLCHGPTELMHYRRCVRWVGDLSVLTTKSLVTALETARHHISTLIQGKICNISAMSIDPIHLIRILAAEKVSLEFALPDFLRQLDACTRHCPGTRLKLPHGYLSNAHLTDKNFVIRHYLTQQNFNQQLKQQYNI